MHFKYTKGNPMKYSIDRKIKGLLMEQENHSKLIDVYMSDMILVMDAPA